jgi:hypothetical protein
LESIHGWHDFRLRLTPKHISSPRLLCLPPWAFIAPTFKSPLALAFSLRAVILAMWSTALEALDVWSYVLSSRQGHHTVQIDLSFLPFSGEFIRGGSFCFSFVFAFGSELCYGCVALGFDKL